MHSARSPPQARPRWVPIHALGETFGLYPDPQDQRTTTTARAGRPQTTHPESVERLATTNTETRASFMSFIAMSFSWAPLSRRRDVKHSACHEDWIDAARNFPETAADSRRRWRALRLLRVTLRLAFTRLSSRVRIRADSRRTTLRRAHASKRPSGTCAIRGETCTKAPKVRQRCRGREHSRSGRPRSERRNIPSRRPEPVDVRGMVTAASSCDKMIAARGLRGRACRREVRVAKRGVA